jgi:hypothetical protein
MNIARILVRLAKGARDLCLVMMGTSLVSSCVSALRSRDWIAAANAEMSCACFASISPGRAGGAVLPRTLLRHRLLRCGCRDHGSQ